MILAALGAMIFGALIGKLIEKEYYDFVSAFTYSYLGLILLAICELLKMF